MSIFVLAIVTLSAVSVTFKKVKTPRKQVQLDTEIICNSKNEAAYNKNGDYCNFLITPPPAQKNKNGESDNGISIYDGKIYVDLFSKEFVTIELKGGGAGGSQYVSGGAGEERRITYPSLIRPLGCPDGFEPFGTFRCIKNKEEICVNGYKMMSDGSCQLNFYYRLYPGKGGSGNAGGLAENGKNTRIEIFCLSKDNDKCINADATDVSLGIFETALGGRASNTSCADDDCKVGSSVFGSGGDPGKSGNDGEVKITW